MFICMIHSLHGKRGKTCFFVRYVGEGMEEGELSEARENLGFLEKDYLDVLSEE